MPQRWFLRSRLEPEARGLECRSVGPATRAAVGKFAIDNDGRDRANPEALGPVGNAWLLHVEHLNVARVAREALDQRDRFVASRASGCEDFHLSLTIHRFILRWLFGREREVP